MGETGILAPDARVELIDGEIIDMTPIGSAHAGIVDRLAHAFGAAADDRAIVAVQNPIALGERSEPRPDLALLASREDFHADAHPCAEDVPLLVEVADSTLAYDRDVKLPLYALHGIAEAWLVDVGGGGLTVHRDPGPEGYRETRTARPGETLAPRRAPTIAPDLSALSG